MPFRIARRDQTFLLPCDVDEWIAPDHPARFVWAYVEALDLATLGISALPAELGAPSYPPKELLACWLYGFMDRRRSTRALEKACRESLPYMWLLGLLHPDHMTLWRFYDAHRTAMRDLFRSTVRVAVEAGMVDFALQCIDGSKIAVTSADQLRRKAALEKLLATVECEIAAMEEQEEREAGDEPPAPRARRHKAKAKKEDVRDRLREAMARIAEAEAEGKPAPTAQATDPEARVMKTRHGWQVGYNAQVLVDAKDQIIVAADVTQQNYDSDQLVPLLEQEQRELGGCAKATLADNGYFSASNIAYAGGRTDLYVRDNAYEKSIKKASDYHFSRFQYLPEQDVFICPQGQRLFFVRPSYKKRGRAPGRQYQCQTCGTCSVREQCTKCKRGRTIKTAPYSMDLQAHRGKMATEAACALLRQRGSIVEAVFGILKEQRGANRFQTRGLCKVQQEWYLLCAAFNLHKLYKNWLKGLGTTAHTTLSPLHFAFLTWWRSHCTPTRLAPKSWPVAITI